MSTDKIDWFDVIFTVICIGGGIVGIFLMVYGGSHNL